MLSQNVQTEVNAQSLEALQSESLQREVLLRRIVSPNRDSEFGRKHRFSSIESVRDFRDAVPICSYEDLRADIDRMRAGEQGVLVSQPVRRFFVTSGSSSLPKYIPVTSSFIRDKWRAFETYWRLALQDHPNIFRGGFVRNFSDGSREKRTPTGMLCSSESSFWSAWSVGGCGGMENPLPRDLLNIADLEARYYTIGRVLLETDVSGLMALNPSTIFRLFSVIEDHAESLLRDIERGGLSDAITVEPAARRYVADRYVGNPKRAQELQPFVRGSQAAFDAASVWPNLNIAICWRSMMVRPYLQLLEPFLQTVPQRDYITMASEGIIAIPFEDGASGGALAVDVHFYEFIPEEFADRQYPSTLIAHELEVGKNYVVVLSTSAGLYRYNIGDVVKVKRFLGSTPVLEFLYREGHTCSLTGEKLTEEQVASAVCATASLLGLCLQKFTLCPVLEPFPHYALVAELDTASDRNLLSRFVGELDRDLARRNIEYHSKRESRRLGSPEFRVVRPGSYAELHNRRIAGGASDAQVKLPCLTRDTKWYEQFDFVEQIACE